MMEELRRLHYPVPLISRLMDISSSGFYTWLDRPVSKRAKEESRLELEIKAANQRTRNTYCPERLQHYLKEHGVQVSIYKIRRIRRKFGIRCIQKRKFKVTTRSDHGLPVAENILGQDFKVYQPNKVWLSDITYIPTEEGWLYLAAHKDLFNNEIVGYAMGARLSQYLVGESLLKALGLRKPTQGLLHHSDRGSQYCAAEYRQILKSKGIQVSMSRRGNCYDNAPMESFWGILKQELVHHRHYITRREAMNEIREYIEIFYNRQRIQDKLGFLSPVEYARQYNEMLLAA
jgi:putative transposase